MAQYPIIENIAILNTKIEDLTSKIVTNLIVKGITGISTSNTLTQLVNKILDITYVPINSRAARSRSMAPSIIDTSITTLNTKLDTLYERFKLNLGVMGVTNIPKDATLNILADKILDVIIPPSYDLYPESLIIPANGTAKEFYFNTADAVKVDFSLVDNPNGAFSINRTTGQGPSNFIIKVTATNNTTVTEKIGCRIKISLDNGKWIKYVTLKQSAGVQTFTLTNPNTVLGSTFNAGGNNITDTTKNYTYFKANYNTLWNGIITNTVVVDGKSSNFSSAIVGEANGFTISNSQAYGSIVGISKKVSLAAATSTAVKCTYNGVSAATNVSITQQENKVTGYIEAFCFMGFGSTTTEITMPLPAYGIPSSDTTSKTAFISLRAKQRYSSGSIYGVFTSFGQNSVTSITSSLPGSTILAYDAYYYKMLLNSRGIIEGAQTSGVLSITATSAEGYIVSASKVISQEQNKLDSISINLEIVPPDIRLFTAAGGSISFNPSIIYTYTSEDYYTEGKGGILKLSNTDGFSFNGINKVTIAHRGSQLGAQRTCNVTATHFHSQFGTITSNIISLRQDQNTESSTTEVVDAEVKYRCRSEDAMSMPYNIQRSKHTYSSGTITYSSNYNVDIGSWSLRDGQCNYFSRTLAMAFSPVINRATFNINGIAHSWPAFGGRDIVFAKSSNGIYNFTDFTINGVSKAIRRASGSENWTLFGNGLRLTSDGLSGSCVIVH